MERRYANFKFPFSDVCNRPLPPFQYLLPPFWKHRLNFADRVGASPIVKRKSTRVSLEEEEIDLNRWPFKSFSEMVESLEQQSAMKVNSSRLQEVNFLIFHFYCCLLFRFNEQIFIESGTTT